MLPYRRAASGAPAPASGTFTVLADSLWDRQVTQGGVQQGATVRNSLAASLGLTDVGKGGAPQSAVLGAPVASGGHVTSVPVTTPGAAYVVAPAVTITGGTFSVQATAVAVLGQDGSVVGVTITNSGTYTVNPTGATIGAVGITNATLTATVAGNAVTGFTVGAGGSNYPSWGASLFFTTQGGDTITAAAYADATNQSGGALTSWLAGSSSGGAGYAHAPLLLPGSSNNHARGAIAATTMIDNTGIGGVDSAVLTYRVRCVNANANLVIVNYGTNDLNTAGNGGGHDAAFNPANFAAAYQTVLTAIRGQASNPLIALVGLGPMDTINSGYPAAVPAWATSKADAVRQYNQAIAELAAANGARFVNLAGLDYPTMCVNYAASNLHWNAVGQAFVAARILAAIYGVD